MQVEKKKRAPKNEVSLPAVGMTSAQIEKERKKIQAKLLPILSEMNNYRETHLVYFFKPYPWMERAIELIRTKNIVLIPAPNKIGKCVSYHTLIDSDKGKVTIGSLFEKGKPFKVWAWDGEKKVKANATAPFKKDGLHECYRIEMSDGRFIEAADHHMILTENGYESVERIAFSHSRPSSESLPLTNSEPYQLVRALDGLNWMGTSSDCHLSYSESSRLCDGQPLASLKAFLSFLRQQVDALGRTSTLLRSDDLACKCKHILQQFCVLPSSLCEVSHPLAQFFASLMRDFCKFFLLYPLRRQAEMQLSVAGASLPPQDGLLSFEILDHEHKNSFLSPVMVDSNRIISIIPIGRKEVYDFTVEKYHNYCAGGMVHHNTALNCCLIHSWLVGYEPWNEVDKEYPGAVRDRVDGRIKYFKPSSLGIRPPVDIRLSGDDWYTHFGRTIIPELAKWLPLEEYKINKNTMGFNYLYTHKKTKSTLELFTYNQKAAEKWMGHGWIPDEPPPKSLFGGMSRGVFLNGGKVYMPVCPLEEAWMLDDIALSDRSDIGVIDDLTILDNNKLYTDDTKTLEGMGLNKDQRQKFFDLLLYEDKEKRIFVKDQGLSAANYVEEKCLTDKIDDSGKLKLLRFVRDTPSDLAATRFGGQFKALSGRILKEFDKSIHWIKPFDIPTHWPVEVHVDIALSKPQAIAYYAVNEQGIKYVIKERYEHLSANGIRDAIIRDMNRNSWRIRKVYIDPLAKGDTLYMKNQMEVDIEDTFTKLENGLQDHGIELYVGSKDKESGIRAVIDALVGPNGLPTLLFFNNLTRHLQELYRWVYDKNGNYPKGSKDDYDDMMECLYRSFLTGFRYKPPREHSSQSFNRRVGASNEQGGWLLNL